MAHIYLIGMMGSGKSVTGKALAGLMRTTFIDLDSEIEKKADSTIERIFEVKGEFEFREMESAALKEAAESEEALVVATGGGAVLREANVELMKKTGKIVYLDTTLDMLWSRVKDSTTRPLLKKADPYDRLAAIYKQRQPIYEAAADFSTPTDGLTGLDVATDIRNLFKSES